MHPRYATQADRDGGEEIWRRAEDAHDGYIEILARYVNMADVLCCLEQHCKRTGGWARPFRDVNSLY